MPAKGMDERRIRERLTSALVTLGLFVLALPMLFPLYWMVSSSLKSEGEIFKFPPVMFPANLRFDNFEQVFTIQPFAIQYFNSVYIATLNVLGTLIVASLAGYAFARIPFRGRSWLFVLLLSALLMPIEVLIIPLYVLMAELGWLGTHIPLIVEPIFGIPSIVGTFLMRQYFLSLPGELEDAARMDGLGRFGIFWRIAMPLAKPALASVAILTFLASWNSFLEPLVFVAGDPELMTIPIALTGFRDFTGEPYWAITMAAATLSVLPMLIVFLFAQRYFVQGIARVGIHG